MPIKAKEEKISGVQFVSGEKNRGKGYAVRRGVQEATGNLILFMDADNSTKIIELSHFMTEIRSCDIVIGSRALERSKVPVSQNPLKQALGKVGNKLIKVILGLDIDDTQCGFKLYSNKIKEVFARQKLDVLAIKASSGRTSVLKGIPGNQKNFQGRSRLPLFLVPLTGASTLI